MKTKILSNVLNLLQSIKRDQLQHPLYCVVEKISQQQTNNTLFSIKIGKNNNELKKTAQEIIDDDIIISLLSPHDVREITITALQEKYQPLYKVVDHTYYPDLHAEIVKIQDNKSGIVEHKLIDEAIYDPAIYLNTSTTSAYRFGYIAGLKHKEE